MESYEKVVILLQGYLIRYPLKDKVASLISDTRYIIQNSIRILRCILDVCLKRKKVFLVNRLLKWIRCIEHRLFPGEHPLR
jgi:activating signal cointegrator complex subunit 3